MNVLVLGAAGMLGHTVCRVLAADHHVTGTIRGRWDPADPLARFLDQERCIEGLDVLDGERLGAAIADTEPDVVVNCVGIVKQLAAANDAVASIRCNSLLPHELALLCQAHGARLVHLSTDCVFSGRQGAYSERDVPDPVDLYGRSKLLGELADSEGLTLRTSIVGRQLSVFTSLFEWVLSHRGGQVRGFDRAIYSGLTTLVLARVLGQVITDHPDLSGVWHVASEPITKYDLICRLNELMGLGIEVERDEDFVCDRSLDGSAFTEATGILVPSWDEMLREFVADDPTYDGIREMVSG